MSNIDPFNPSAPLSTGAPATTISPKVIWATLLGGVLVPALLAVGTYVLAHEDVLGINNPVLGTFVFALITGAVTFLAGYAKTDPLRRG